MRARSRMAALALVVGTSFAVGRAMPALVDEPNLRQDSSERDGESQIATRDEEPKVSPHDDRVD